MSSRSNNRTKTYQRVSKRPRDKHIKILQDVLVTPGALRVWEAYAIKINSSIQCAQTFKGIRWNMTFLSANANVGWVRWAIILLERHNAVTPTVANNIAATAEAIAATPVPGNTLNNFYDPDEKVIVHGHGMCTDDQAYIAEGETKAMRKLKPGDNIALIYWVASEAVTQTIFVNGGIQWVALS